MSEGGDIKNGDAETNHGCDPSSIKENIAEIRTAIECFAANYETNNREQNSAQRRNETLNRRTSYGVIAYTILTAVIMVINTCQYRLIRQQIVGTQGAIINPNVNLSDNEVDVIFDNVGHVTAKNLRAHIKVEKFSWPSDKTIGTPIEYNVEWAAIGVGDGGNTFRQERIPLLPDWLPKFQDSMRTVVSVKINVGFSYDDGFGTIIPQATICRAMVPSYKFISVNGPILDGGGAVTCEVFSNDIEVAQRRTKAPPDSNHAK
jgi:hypothetical protein